MTGIAPARISPTPSEDAVSTFSPHAEFDRNSDFAGLEAHSELELPGKVVSQLGPALIGALGFSKAYITD